jgi:hypothetical protein
MCPAQAPFMKSVTKIVLLLLIYVTTPPSVAATYNLYFNNTEQGDNSQASPQLTVESPSTLSTSQASPVPVATPTAPPVDGIPIGRFVAGGVVGSVFGLGIGHMVQGNWVSKGWKFTFGEALAYGLILGGSIDTASARYSSSTSTRYSSSTASTRTSSQSSTMVLSGILLYGGLRVWEIIDLWSTKHYRPNKQAANSDEVTRFAPIALIDKASGFLGLQMTF